MPNAITLTPEQEQEYNAAAAQAKPQPVNPLKDFDAATLADLAVKDKTFNVVDEFRSKPDLHADPAIVQKAADALDILEKRGFKFSDLPSVKEAGGAVLDSAKGFGKQLWNYANVAGNVIGAAVTAPFSPGLSEGYAEGATERLNKNLAGTEEAMAGLSQLPGKAFDKAGRVVDSITGTEKTPAQKLANLWDKVGKAEVAQERSTGQGPAMQFLNQGQATKQDPHEVAQLAAGDPLSFYAFGKATDLIGAGAKVAAVKVAPKLVEGISDAAAKVGAKAAEKVPEYAGNLVEMAGTAGKVAAEKIVQPAGKVLSVAGPVVGGVLAASGVDLTHAGLGGVLAGTAGVALKRAGQEAVPIMKGLQRAGQEIAGETAVTGAYTQATKDFLQALPSAAGQVAHGAAIDLGLAAATSESPQDTQGAAAFGTALGALHGAARVGGHIVSGQLIAPREYGINKTTPSSGQFKSFDAMTSAALTKASPAVKARLNAVREFASGAAPGTDVFIGFDDASVEKALVDHGVPANTAKDWSKQTGFFTTDLKGKDGTNRRVIVLRDVDAAPHESFHAVQDVLGEAANQQIDKIVKDAYADRWDEEGQRYANRLSNEEGTWQEKLLDASGWGLTEAKEKLYRDIFNKFSVDNGTAPRPEMVKAEATEKLGQLMDAAVKNNQHVPPNEISRKIWREVLSPDEAQGVADKYMARELAAENFDALFKHAGPKLNVDQGVIARLSQIVGKLATAIGGEPLADRTSDMGKVPLRTPVVEAVRQVGKESLANVAPEVAAKLDIRSNAPAPVVPRGGSTPPPDIAAEEARQIAAEAPDTVPDEPIHAAPAPVTPPAAGSPAPAAPAPAPVAPPKRSSPREILGKVAEAIASRMGIKINYLSAPGEPAAATTSNRDTRRAIIEAFRKMPAEAKSLWEKTFFPDRVIKLKGDKYQILGWAPEVFAANAHKMAGFLADHAGISPYDIDPATKTFTPDGWKALYDDVQKFVQNQKAGQTGSGEPLVVPREMLDAGFTAPAKTGGGAGGLEQRKADFINLLFNFRLPDTARITGGKMPLNIAGQEISKATKPGRVEVPVEPRDTYTGDAAQKLGIEGRDIMEVNPLRNELEAAAKSSGEKLPSLIEAIQRLNLENIKEVEGDNISPEFRGNTLTLTAGFQPKPITMEDVERIKGRTQSYFISPKGEIYDAKGNHYKFLEENRKLLGLPERGEDYMEKMHETMKQVTDAGWVRVNASAGHPISAESNNITPAAKRTLEDMHFALGRPGVDRYDAYRGRATRLFESKAQEDGHGAQFQPVSEEDRLTPTVRAGGKSWTGKSHADAINKISKSGDTAALMDLMTGQPERGFTRNGEFISRQDAAEHFLKQTGKDRSSLMKPDEGLHSEDLRDAGMLDHLDEAKAQFQPDSGNKYPAKTEAGKEVEDKGFEFAYSSPSEWGGALFIKKDGNIVGNIEWDRDPMTKSSAQLNRIRINPEFRNQGLSKSLYRELATILQKQGVTELKGDVVSEHALAARKSVFKENKMKLKTGDGDPVYEGLPYWETKSKVDPKAQYQPERAQDDEHAPVFYSQLQKVVRDAKQENFSAAQLANMVKNPQTGVKAEELKWSGLDDFLKGKEKVTKSEVLDFLKQNEIKLEEVVNGGKEKPGMNDEWSDLTYAFDGDYDYVGELSMETGHPSGETKPLITIFKKGDEIHIGDETGQPILGQPRFDTLEEAKRYAYDKALDAYQSEIKHSHEDGTKHASWKLPGGENYRELLMQWHGQSNLQDIHNRREALYKQLNAIRGHESPDNPGFKPATPEEMTKRAELFDKIKALDQEMVKAKEKVPDFRNNHWDEKNVLAHTRVQDMRTPEGERVLLAEEIQSDWHQLGRKEGYQKPVSEDNERRAEAVHTQLKEIAKEATAAQAEFTKGDSTFKSGDFTTIQPGDLASVLERNLSMDLLPESFADKVRKSRELTRELRQIIAEDDRNKDGAPDAPFKSTWHELVFKRLLRMAAEEGYDRLGWVTGEQSADRYDLSKHVERVSYNKVGDKIGLHVEDKNGSIVIAKSYKPEELPDVIGKEITERILKGEGKPAQVEMSNGDVIPMKSFTGLDLKIGGEGMQGFYDKMIPDFARKYAKKWGAEVKDVRVVGDSDSGANDWFTSEDRARRALRDSLEVYGKDSHGHETLIKSEDEVPNYDEYIISGGTHTVHSINITPEMKASVLNEGQRQFQPEKAREEIPGGRPLAPVFYSQLQRVIGNAKQEVFSVDQLRNMVKNPQSGVKAEELKWSGLEDFLKDKKKVSKADVLDYLKQNEIRIEEEVQGTYQTDPNFDFDSDGYEIVTEDSDGEPLDAAELHRHGDFISEVGSVEEAHRLAKEHYIEDVGMETVDDTRHGEEDLRTPGGENYREMLLILPRKSAFKTVRNEKESTPSIPVYDVVDVRTGEVRGTYDGFHAMQFLKELEPEDHRYNSSHWTQRNVIAHARVQDFRVAGQTRERALHADEIQSDWHQAGREHGYKTEEVKFNFAKAQEEFNRNTSRIQELEQSPRSAERDAEIESLQERQRALQEGQNGYSGAAKSNMVPDAPFKTSWHELVFKRLLREAAEQGYHRLTWTTGETQSDRYSLAKHLSKVEASPWKPAGTQHVEGYNILGYDHDNQIVVEHPVHTEDLAETVGQELAAKIIKDLKDEPSHLESGLQNRRTYEGLDLEVGGEGMKGFYDKILPDFARSYGKKWNAKVEPVEIITDRTPSGNRGSRQGAERVWSIQITPEMRNSVMFEGQRQFQPKPLTERDIENLGQRSRSFWISPRGKIFDAGADHNAFLRDNPELFGLTPEAVKDADTRAAFARRAGWARVNVGGGFTISFDGRMSPTMQRTLEDLHFASGKPGVESYDAYEGRNKEIIPRETEAGRNEWPDGTNSAQFAPPKPNEEVRKIAEDYAKDFGLTNYKPRDNYAKLDEKLSRELADLYEFGKHDPTDKAVAASYDAFNKENEAQWDAIKFEGYTIEPWKGAGEPYKSSDAMREDVEKNKHLFYLPTDRKSFKGSRNNPMLKKNSGGMLNNDAFRAVHDFFGHAKEGFQFGPRGEFNAWASHSQMYSDAAQGALAAETLAQNSWVTYGPHMRDESGNLLKETDKGYLKLADRPFAEQKSMIVPANLIERARKVADRTELVEPVAEKKTEGLVEKIAKVKKALGSILNRVEVEPKVKAQKKIADIREASSLKMKPSKTGFSKAWILPDGQVAQLGGMWHHDWLANDPQGIAVAKKYGVEVTPFKGTEDDVTRNDAMKKGFVRVNLDTKTGRIVVESIESKWPRLRGVVGKLAERNLDQIDVATVSLFDDNVEQIRENVTKRLFQLDTDEEKMAEFPLLHTEKRTSLRGLEGPQFFDPPSRQSQPGRAEVEPMTATPRLNGRSTQQDDDSLVEPLDRVSRN